MTPPLLVLRHGEYVRVEDSAGVCVFAGNLGQALLELARTLVRLDEQTTEVGRLLTLLSSPPRETP